MALSQFASADENPSSPSRAGAADHDDDHQGAEGDRHIEQLNLSPKTVNSYRYRLFSKLGINGDVGADPSGHSLWHAGCRYPVTGAWTPKAAPAAFAFLQAVGSMLSPSLHSSVESSCR